MPTDEQIWKMLDAWYALAGRRVEPTAEARERDFNRMKRAIEQFEVEKNTDSLEGARRVSSVVNVSLGYYGCKQPPGACGCPQDVRKDCSHSHWVSR